jgi:hypothetical protein
MKFTALPYTPLHAYTRLHGKNFPMSGPARAQLFLSGTRPLVGSRFQKLMCACDCLRVNKALAAAPSARYQQPGRAPAARHIIMESDDNHIRPAGGEAESPLPPAMSEDELTLRRMGYKQELSRRMTGFSNFAISLSIICILAGGVTSFQYGFCTVGERPSAWAGRCCACFPWWWL